MDVLSQGYQKLTSGLYKSCSEGLGDDWEGTLMKLVCSGYKMECMKNHCPLLGQLRSPRFLVTGE